MPPTAYWGHLKMIPNTYLLIFHNFHPFNLFNNVSNSILLTSEAHPTIVTFGDFHNLHLFKELEREGRPAAGRTPLKTLVNSRLRRMRRIY